VELLPREEVALLFGSLTACGFLILGVLDVLWPTTRRRRTRAQALAAPAAALQFRPAESVTIDRPLPPPPSALAVGRLLLGRAVAEPDLERRVTILTRAVAGLTRAAQGRPDDAELAATLSSARARLWATWEEIARARLAAAMPWGAVETPARPGGATLSEAS
jgi:hypothetical protein